MLLLAKLISILIICIGVALSANPSLSKSFIAFARVGKRYFIGVAVRISFGIIILLAAPKSSCPWGTVIFGALFVISGIVLAVLGEERLHKILDWLDNKPEKFIRIIAILPIILGLVLFITL